MNLHISKLVFKELNLVLVIINELDWISHPTFATSVILFLLF